VTEAEIPGWVTIETEHHADRASSWTPPRLEPGRAPRCRRSE
jgi:hypothetical protein